MKRRGQCLLRAVIRQLGVLLAVLAFDAHAERSPVAFQSTYLGDGWFEYSVMTTDDPFFLFLDITGAGVEFGPAIEEGPLPAQWTNLLHTNFMSWSFDGIGLGDQARPYRGNFRLRSAHTTFKRKAGSGLVLMSLSIAGGYHGHLASANIVGYWIPDVLVPCPPEQADGSATNLVHWCPMISQLPAPRLASLIQSGGEQVGVSFDYPEPSTVRLEGTRDFRAWTNVAYIHGAPGVTPWTTNVSLSNYGDFFRLRLVAEGHTTNLPPLSSSSPELAPGKMARGSAPRLNAAPEAEGIEITVGNLFSQSASVTQLDSNLRRTETLPIKRTGQAIAVQRPAGLPLVFYEVQDAR